MIWIDIEGGVFMVLMHLADWLGGAWLWITVTPYVVLGMPALGR